jgi:hypothetical protein
MEWVRLLPFTSRPSDGLAVLQKLPKSHQWFQRLEEIVRSIAVAPGADAEALLFQIAEDEPALYKTHDWIDAVFRRGTLSADRRFIDLVANGVLERDSVERWHLSGQVGAMMNRFPELRSEVYQRLRPGTLTPGTLLLAEAVAESPDEDGVLLLVELENATGQRLVSWRTIEAMVTEHVPAVGYQGAYNVVPVQATNLRRRLLALVGDGGERDVAARCLRWIDQFRSEYGTPDSEPRHPDFGSGRPWPIMIPVDDEEG